MTSDTRERLARVERAVEALRRGAWVRVAGARPVLAAAAETLTPEGLAALRALGAPDLALTHQRAATLKMRLYTPDVVALPVGDSTAGDLRALADPTDDLMHPLRGPFAVRRAALPTGYAAAVRLAKLAGLLPAAVVLETAAGRAEVALNDTDPARYEADTATGLSRVTEAHVPLEGAPDTRIIGFRASDGGPEHLALVIGTPGDPPLVRLHSECFTGDLLGSLKCDCGAQLKGAIATMARAGGGIVLYLAQEGRGIGLMNKLRAYRLQDQGFDTMDANTRLGFEEDERDFAVAVSMLRLLDVRRIRLLTNNPDKVARLSALGIEVAERVPHSFPANPHNAHYLATKRLKGGHTL